MRNKYLKSRIFWILVAVLTVVGLIRPLPTHAQGDDPTPPAETAGRFPLLR